MEAEDAIILLVPMSGLCTCDPVSGLYQRTVTWDSVEEISSLSQKRDRLVVVDEWGKCIPDEKLRDPLNWTAIVAATTGVRPMEDPWHPMDWEKKAHYEAASELRSSITSILDRKPGALWGPLCPVRIIIYQIVRPIVVGIAKDGTSITDSRFQGMIWACLSATMEPPKEGLFTQLAEVAVLEPRPLPPSMRYYTGTRRITKGYKPGIPAARGGDVGPQNQAQGQTGKGLPLPKAPKFLPANEWAALSPEGKEKLRAERKAAKAARVASQQSTHQVTPGPPALPSSKKKQKKNREKNKEARGGVMGPVSSRDPE